MYPTSMELLSEEEFREMRIGEEEVGFANMEAPKGFLPPEKQSGLPEENRPL